MAVAAVVAWFVARQVDEPQSFIAPYAAVFMMSGTIYQSLIDAARHVSTVVLGVVIAFVVAVTIPWQAAALAAAVFVGMVVGRWHRLGRDGIWVGVVALLMITYGTAAEASYLFFRIGEAVFGALVGIVVNVLIVPPIYLRDVGRAVAGVSGEVEELLRAMAEEIRGDWGLTEAQRWRRRAHALETVVRRAEDASGHGRESMRFNPRRLWSRETHPSTEDDALSSLYAVAAQVQQVAETLVASSEPDSTAPRTGQVFDKTVASVLDELADAVATYQAAPPDRELDDDAIAEALRHVRDRRAALARLVPWPDHQPPKDWSSHAAVLLAIERAFQAMQNASTHSYRAGFLFPLRRLRARAGQPQIRQKV